VKKDLKEVAHIPTVVFKSQRSDDSHLRARSGKGRKEAPSLNGDARINKTTNNRLPEDQIEQ